MIESAAGTFLRRGFDATSMDDVAQDAGVSRLILYRIFDSKHDLYRTVLQSVIDHLGVAVEPYDVDALRTRGAAWVLLPVARAHPDAFRLLWRRALHEPQFADLALGVQEIFVFYARGIVGHYLDHDDVRLEWAARTASAHLVEGLCTWLDLGDPGARRRSRRADGRRPACPDDGVGVGAAARQCVTAVATASTIRSICSSVVTSGGQNVIVSGGMALVTTPSSSNRSRTAGDC